MKAEEIRTTNFGPANSDTKAVMAVLFEIAAQLAEMNEANALNKAELRAAWDPNRTLEIPPSPIPARFIEAAHAKS